MRSAEPGTFKGNERFELIRTIGVGGMGVVYEALDRSQSARVALKTLRLPDSEALLRLKKEFRSLQDLVHPNLIALGELLEDDGRWFFTMELIRGCTFTQYVRGGGMPELVAEPVTADGPTRPAPARSAGGLDLDRLQAATVQLVDAVGALHASGKIHRDIKPTNVLVDGDGRVVVLDFGLIMDVEDNPEWSRSRVVGTPLYMAPEQASGGPVGPPADWYAVGGLLYEAMTGRPPFLGDPRGDGGPPPAPRTLRAGVPEHLDRLCMELLARDPAARPTGEEIRARLGASPTSSAASAGPDFVGRRDELARLHEAWTAIGRGEPRSIVVTGTSGIGKTALVRELARQVGDAPATVVLRGRCYEGEQVPFKAVDGVIDSLVRFLGTLSPTDRAVLVPRRVGHLTRVFPVLGGVDVFADYAREPAGGRDPQQLRRYMFVALRELFCLLAERFQVLLVIDDLQWADVDSLSLLAELTRAPDAPPMLLVATYRPLASGGVSRDELERLPEPPSWLQLGGLSAEEARALIAARAGSGRMADADLDALIHEAEGHPLFLGELVDQLGSAVHSSAGCDRPRLEDAIARRVAALPPEQRELLRVVSLAGAPLPRQVLVRALDVSASELARTVQSLVVGRLLSSSGRGTDDPVESYHDRIRDAIVATIDDDQRPALHLGLAEAMAACGGRHDALAHHYAAAGRSGEALEHAVEAARVASAALAFDQAAGHYRLALSLVPPDDRAGERALVIALADELARAGRGAEAARAYLRAAAMCDGEEALSLREHAAGQLLSTGYVDEALRELRVVLDAHGLSFPRTARSAFTRILAARLALRLRGLGVELGREGAGDTETLRRIDLCWSASIGLSTFDPIRGHLFHLRSLRSALDCGEPYRASRALSMEAAFLSTLGRRSAAKAGAILDRARELAAGVGNAHAEYQLNSCYGLRAMLTGRFSDAVRYYLEADRIVQEQHIGVIGWERAVTTCYLSQSLLYAGQLADLGERVPDLIAVWRERGNLYGQCSLAVSVLPFVLLARDTPQAAADAVEDGLRRWATSDGGQIMDYYGVVAQGAVALYRRMPQEVLDRMPAVLAALRRSLVLNVPFIKVTLADLEARALLQHARASGAAPARRCRRLVSTMRGELEPSFVAMSQLISAGMTSCCGDRDAAAAQYRAASRALEACGMELYAASARWRHGEHAGGAAELAESRAWLESQGIADPEAFVAVIAP